MGIPKYLMREWIIEIDINKDGNISFDEFIKQIRNSNSKKATLLNKAINIEEASVKTQNQDLNGSSISRPKNKKK